MRFPDLWQWEGTVSRSTYALVGFIGFAAKYNLDRIVARFCFHRSWGLSNYWMPLGPAVHITQLASSGAAFAATLVALALPFIWVGVSMTVRRLRDAGLPVWLACLFFVPVVNLVFFVLLCALPARARGPAGEAAPWPGPRFLDALIPRSEMGSAALAIFLTALLGLGFVLLGTVVANVYGWGLFVALPFCLGLFSVLLHSYREPRSLGPCMGVAALSVGMLAVALLMFAVEGLICLLMAAPLGLLLALLGGGLGYSIQSHHWDRAGTPALLSAVLLFLPGFLGLEHMARVEPPTLEVHTAIEVNAAPEQVWREVIAFSQIPEPHELLFRAGIAYPLRAEIVGHGPGAERHCIFSTGTFVEPIEVWDEPRLLKFGVTSNPEPMQEWTPYGHIDAPHLHGFLVSRAGQFRLTALPDGHTRLEGTTWYRHTMWPAVYWQMWSDYIIHRIHLRVLRHIAAEAEHSPGK